MLKINLFIALLALYSCSTKKGFREHGDCNVTTLQTDNNLNDTNRVRFIKSVVFDTTAKFVHGSIVDRNLHRPIANAEVSIFNKYENIYTSTNALGDFEIFQNLENGPWNIVIKHSDYICLYILDVVKTGGQWLYIKLQNN